MDTFAPSLRVVRPGEKQRPLQDAGIDAVEISLFPHHTMRLPQVLIVRKGANGWFWPEPEAPTAGRAGPLTEVDAVVPTK